MCKRCLIDAAECVHLYKEDTHWNTFRFRYDTSDLWWRSVGSWRALVVGGEPLIFRGAIQIPACDIHVAFQLKADSSNMGR